MTKRAIGTALVTGASQRLGKVIAIHLAEQGYDVAVHHRSSDEDARAVAGRIEELGRRAVILQADLSRESELAPLVSAAADELGGLGLLVNNAAIFEEDDFGRMKRESWDMHIDTNLRAPIMLSEAFAAQAAAGASIVNIIDQRVLNPAPEFISYTLSKTGLWSATQLMAKAYAPRVRVNAVGPGPTLPSVHQRPGEFEAEVAATPLKKAVDPAEIAAAVHFLATMPSVTGQLILVDSGQHLGG